MNVYIFEMPFLICDLCKVRKNCAGKGFVEDSTVQCLMVSAILHIPILCKSELNLLCEALFRICFCFRGCGSVHILFFRRIVSKRLFRILDASRGRVAPANPRTVYMRPLRRSKKQKAAYLKRDKRLLAGVEGFEPSARGFGDRCSTN